MTNDEFLSAGRASVGGRRGQPRRHRRGVASGPEGTLSEPPGLDHLRSAGEDLVSAHELGPFSKEKPPLPRVMAIANQKGGVGKTTTAVNLGAALAELGYRVLVIDLDPQGNATTGLGVNARNLDSSIYDVILHDVPIEDCIEPTNLRNLFLVPGHDRPGRCRDRVGPCLQRELRLKRAIGSVLDDFDFLLIDCPPSLGLLTVNALAAAHEVAVPIQCEYYALEGLGQLLSNIERVRANLNPGLSVTTIIMTMYDARTRLAEQVVDEVRRHFGDRVCRSVVPRTVRLSEAPSFGQPIIVFDPTSRGRDGLPGTSQGGKRWRAAAGWVEASERLYRPTSSRDRGALCGNFGTAVRPEPTSAREHISTRTGSASLTASVREIGILQPILVRQTGENEYELIAGERRWRAARRAGMATIPAIIRTASDSESLQQALIENLNREELNPLEEAAGVPAAHRGLRPHPRTAVGEGRQEPRRHNQRPPPVPATSVSATPGG